MPTNVDNGIVAALATLLTDTFGGVRRVTLAPGVSGSALIGALASLGWEIAEDGAADVLVTASGSVLPVGVARPSVVLVLHPGAAKERAWPCWDDLTLAAGYEGCGRAGHWTWYVRDDKAAALGPLLGSLPVTGPNLVEELITWRTAALTRWAARADDESGRPNKELRAELQASKELLAAIQNSFSWRITAPLRGVRALRPPRAVRR